MLWLLECCAAAVARHLKLRQFTQPVSRNADVEYLAAALVAKLPNYQIVKSTKSLHVKFLHA